MANGNTEITDRRNDFDIASHDGSNGLKLGGTLVTSDAAELNYLDITALGTLTTEQQQRRIMMV